jgi:hypothetical protein
MTRSTISNALKVYQIVMDVVIWARVRIFHSGRCGRLSIVVPWDLNSIYHTAPSRGEPSNSLCPQFRYLHYRDTTLPPTGLSSFCIDVGEVHKLLLEVALKNISVFTEEIFGWLTRRDLYRSCQPINCPRHQEHCSGATRADPPRASPRTQHA